MEAQAQVHADVGQDLETRVEKDLDTQLADAREMINRLVASITDEHGNITENDPKRLEETYRQIEYVALTAGKTGVAKAFTQAMIWLGYASLPKELEKLNRATDSIVKGYKGVYGEHRKELDQLGKEKVASQTRLYQTFQLDDILERHKANLTARIGQLEQERGNLIVQGSYEPETERRVRELGEKIEGFKLEYDDTEMRIVENAQVAMNVEREINNTESQYEKVKDRQRSVQVKMYRTMQNRTPTLYLLGNLDTLRRIKALSARMEEISSKRQGYEEAAHKTEELYSSIVAILDRVPPLSDSPASQGTVSREEEHRRKSVQDYTDGIKDQFRARKREALAIYRTQAAPEAKPAYETELQEKPAA